MQMLKIVVALASAVALSTSAYATVYHVTYSTTISDVYETGSGGEPTLNVGDVLLTKFTVDTAMIPTSSSTSYYYDPELEHSFLSAKDYQYQNLPVTLSSDKAGILGTYLPSIDIHLGFWYPNDMTSHSIISGASESSSVWIYSDGFDPYTVDKEPLSILVSPGFGPAVSYIWKSTDGRSISYSGWTTTVSAIPAVPEPKLYQGLLFGFAFYGLYTLRVRRPHKQV